MSNPSVRLRRAAALLAAAAPLSFGACGGDVSASSARTAGAAANTPLGPEIAALAGAAAPYRVAPVGNPGRVHGTVKLEGAAPRDTIVRPTADQGACGRELTDVTIQARNGRLAGAVVWLVGVRAGKPLPIDRRYDLMNDHCQLTPRVQAAVVGGTVNVRSADRLVVHDNRFVRHAVGMPVVARAHTNNSGEVVPVEQVLRAPGLVEVRCDPHAWTRGWLFAFDHPYFATTGADGEFTIDGVPPGRYQLVAWHERTGVVRQEVEVAAGATESAELVMTGGASAER